MVNNSSEKNYEIKIFEIDTSNHKFNGITGSKNIIQHIIDHHRHRIKDLENIGKPIDPIILNPVTYYSYLNEETEKTAYWKNFLPSSITIDQDFKIRNLTYILFACIEDRIFAISGGGGAMVIKK